MPSLTLTPRGHLLFTVTDDAVQPSAALSRRLESAFARGSGHGLLELGAAEVGTVLPADFGYWRDFAARLVTAICMHPDFEAHHAAIPAPAIEELEALAAAAPPMRLRSRFWRPTRRNCRRRPGRSTCRSAAR